MLVSKEWIKEFDENEGHGIDPYPLVEAAYLAHELLEALESLAGTTPDGEASALIRKARGE